MRMQQRSLLTMFCRPAHGRTLIGFLTAIALSCALWNPAAWAVTIHGTVTENAAVPEQKPEPGVVGLNFLIQPQTFPVVMEVYPGTPASNVGLRPGDEVLSVNSRTMRGLSMEQVDVAISDVPGEVVNFLINRQGRTFPVKLTVQSLSNIRSGSVQSLYTQLFP